MDSFSWLDTAVRGQGIGTAMRTAVLTLAFDHLHAEAAVSSAREDNRPSLGVSRRLGYEDNGVSRRLSPTGPCTLRHMILRRDTWRAGGHGSGVLVEGLSGRARPADGREHLDHLHAGAHALKAPFHENAPWLL